MKIERNEDTELFFSIFNGPDNELDPDMDYSMAIDKITEDRGRGSTYYVEYIVEIKEEHAEEFKGVDITPYLGIWKTNNIIDDWEYGTTDTFDELTSVAPNEIQTTTIEWVENE